MADTIIDKVQVQVEATTKGTSQAFAMLDRQLSRLQNALNAVDTSKLQAAQQASKSISIDSRGFTKEEKEVVKALDRIKQAFAGMESYKNAALGGDTSSLTSFSRKAIHLQSDIDTLAERLRQLDDMMQGGNVDSAMFQTYREQLAELQSALNGTQGEVESAVQAMNENKVTLDTEESKSNLDILKEKARSAANTIATTIGRGALNAFKNLASNIKKAASHMKDLGHSTSGTTGQFKRGFMTVLKYGFGIRSLYVLFRRLRKAVVESFGELQKSGAFYETTRANIEALKASLSTLKYQFGAAFEPIFNAIAPALQTLINYLITAANAISAFMAKLTGKSTYSKAVASANDLADATGGAAKAQKELNKQLQGFDELNNLSSNNPSGGGGGGGAAGDSSAVQYVEESVDNALGDFGKQLAEAIRNGDWQAVGEIIGEKLTEQLNGIKWNTLKGKATKFGTDLGNFINGLISPELFGAIGTTIGESINTVLTGTNALGNTIEWKNVGDSVASGINNFVATNPLKLVVENFNTWANGILDALIAAVGGVSWEEIGQHIADAIGKVDAWNIGWKLGTLVDNLVDAVYDLASNKDTWENIGEKVADGINGFFKGFDGEDLADTANAIANGLWTALGTALKNLSWKTIGEDIIGFIGNLDIGTISLIAAVALTPAALTAIKSGLTTILTTTVAGLGGVSVGTIAVSVVAALAIGWKIGNKLYEAATGEEVQGGMEEQLKDVFSGLFGEDKIKFDMSEFLEFTFGESNPWNDFFGDLGAAVYDGQEQLKQQGKDVVTYIGNGISAKYTDLVTNGKTIVEKVKSGISEIAGTLETWFKDNVLSKITGAWDKIKNFEAKLSAKTSDSFNKAKDTVSTMASKLSSIVSNKSIKLKASISDKVTKKMDSIKQKINNLKSLKTINLVTNLKDNVSSKLVSIYNKWKYLKDNLVAKLSATFSDFFTAPLKRAWNGIASGLNKAIAVINKIPGVSISSVPSLAKGGYSDTAKTVVFGEAGAEAIIPLEHNLGAINKIADVMLDGMADSSKFRYNPVMPSSAYNGTITSGFTTGSNDNRTYEAIIAQTKAIDEQNRLLQIIANKNVTISSREVFNATRQEAQNYNNRTGSSPFLF